MFCNRLNTGSHLTADKTFESAKVKARKSGLGSPLADVVALLINKTVNAQIAWNRKGKI
jgi:hypothetical protein